MKNIYPFLIVVFIGFIGNAQIVNIPDSNFKAKLLEASTSNQIAYSTDNVAVKIDANDDGEIQESEAQQVGRLNINNSNISSLIGIDSFIYLTDLDCSSNQLTTLNLNLNALFFLECGFNQLTNLNISNLASLIFLDCSYNQITSLNVTGMNNLFVCDCSNNQLATLDLSGLNNLSSLYCGQNQLSSLDFSDLPNFTRLECEENQFTSLDFVSSVTNLTSLKCNGNLITNMDVSTLTNLTTLVCGDNPITTVDVNSLPDLDYLDCDNTPTLETIFAKNGKQGYNRVLAVPDTVYICADESDITVCNCIVNSYCSFTPGGTFYTVQGNSRYDSESNGCDAVDGLIPNMKYIISNDVASSTLVTDNNGSYYYVQAGTHTITPVFENQNYFTATPISSTVTFPASGSPYIQNFCLSANGTHNDLEIAIFPLTAARPGFDAEYKIIYKNKGTSTQSGTVSFDYYDPIEDFVSATPNFTSQTTNTLHWSFSNLNPFESREILVTFNLNSPLETPALNSGNLITYAATISGTTDETPSDNISNVTQTIVNSFDPNDKTCIEGSQLPVDEVGKYLHYIIRFENTGTANAENIVVKDMIDTTKLDITTLIPLSGSHTFETKISSTNKVEFIFQNINLPFDDANNDGSVAFKIKTLPTLVEGNVINNSASIYFDYNAPIVTATNSVTVFNPLLNNEFEFNSIYSLSPVPAKNYLTITAKQDVTMSSLSIYNTLGQVVQVITNPSETIDVSGLTSGSYFIKIISDKGTASAKFVKE